MKGDHRERGDEAFSIAKTPIWIHGDESKMAEGVPAVPNNLRKTAEAFCAPEARYCDFSGQCERPEHFRCPETAFSGSSQLSACTRRALEDCAGRHHGVAREACRWGVLRGATPGGGPFTGGVACSAANFPDALADGVLLGMRCTRDPRAPS